MERYGLSLVTQMAFTTLLRLEQRSPLTVQRAVPARKIRCDEVALNQRQDYHSYRTATPWNLKLNIAQAHRVSQDGGVPHNLHNGNSSR